MERFCELYARSRAGINFLYIRGMKAVLLARVSTDKEQQETSIDRQLARLEDIARVRGWTVVARLTETESGRSVEQRAAIIAALELVRTKRADVLVVDHLFRFGRNTKEMLATVDHLNNLGGSLYEADHHFDTTTPAGRLFFTIMAAVGEFYAGEGIRKIREGQARARQNGKTIGRPRSLDYADTDTARGMRAGGATWDEIATALGGTAGAWSRRLSRVD